MQGPDPLIDKQDIRRVEPSSEKRIRIGVVFGGRSAEHDVSVLSATNVMAALDPVKYDAVPIFVTRQGTWLASRYDEGVLEQPSTGGQVCLMPGGEGRMTAIEPDGTTRELEKLDILFPVLHGLPGEDGSVQGYAETACVPLAGCGILGSATALDKDITKRLLKAAGIPAARSLTIRREERPGFDALEAALGMPVFIKPARQGSSVGISKVAGETDYAAALEEGFKHDRVLLAEEFIEGREIECAVIEDAGGELFVSRPGEIAPAENHGFYSYDAKYVDAGGAGLHVPADLPQTVEDNIRKTAAEAFRAVGCDAMARIDFFLREDMTFLVNELNTIPGFTDISMYSKAMAASGIAYGEIIDRLVAHGLARAGK